MRLLAIAFLVAASALAACSVGRSTTAPEARVRLLDPSPVTLRGIGFAPNERIRVLVLVDDRRAVRKTQAGRAGRFTMRFLDLRYDRCSGSLAVTARGSRGSRVSWKLVPLDCPDRQDS